MDHGQFDDLTRFVVDEGGTRRALLRFLPGAVFGCLFARLGAINPVDAKSKRRRRDARNGAAPQTEGNKKQKKRKNKRKNRKREPQPSPPSCGAGQWQCPDGTCIGLMDCCPGMKSCGDGTCVNPGQCCYGEWQCADGTCVAEGECCANERRCTDGSCVSAGQCCPDEKRCGESDCIATDQCCPDDPAPLCNHCQTEVCENGSMVCREKGTTPTRPAGQTFSCDSGACQCPSGYVACGGGSCCPDNSLYGYCDEQGRCCRRSGGSSIYYCQ